MKAIVTGGLGFIGSNLCQALRNDTWENWEIFVVDDMSSGYESNKFNDITYIIRDITDPGLMDSLLKVVQPDIIFHLAAQPRVSFSVENPLRSSESNVLGTLRVLDAVRKYSPHSRIINSSSSSVYGEINQFPTSVDHACSPMSPYALQKFQSEQWCKMFSSLYGIDSVSLRYFNVFGPRSRYGGAYSTVLSAWMYSIFVDPSCKSFLEGDGSQSRDFCYVDNVVQANILAALYSKKDFCGEVFNVAQGQSHTLLECKDLLEKISGKPLDLEMRPPRVGDIYKTCADISNTCDILSYNPDIDFEKQVIDMANWYRESYV